jgi:hypothetical protein
MQSDPALPLVFTRQQALRYGVTPNAVTWRAGHGHWQRLRRGGFCLKQTYDACSPEQQHLLTALVALAIDGRLETMSHLTAALAYGWPGPLDLAEDPWFTVGPQGQPPTRRRSGVVRQVASLPPEHVWSCHTFTVTSPARTVADCLRHFPARISLPIADAAVSQGTDVVAVRRILSWQAGWPYVERGRRSAELIDGRRESWLESQSALAHHELGVPTPVPQAAILDDYGREIARVDFLWPEYAVVGEADGWDKYRATDGERTGRTDESLVSLDVLRREKDREDRIRDLGYQVVRWGTADALAPHRRLAGLLARAFNRGDRSRVRGSFRATLGEVSRAPSLLRLEELRDLAGPSPLLATTRGYSSSVGEVG